MRKIEIIKEIVNNNKNDRVFAAFVKEYKQTLLLWISSFIYIEERKNEAEDIMQEFLIYLYNHNPFSKFIIPENESIFQNTFNRYLKNVLVRVQVIKFFNLKREKLNLTYFDRYEVNNDLSSQEDKPNPMENSSTNLAVENYSNCKNVEFLKEELNCHYQNIKNKKGFDILLKNEIEGYSVSELAKIYDCTENNISTTKWRAKEELKLHFNKIYHHKAA